MVLVPAVVDAVDLPVIAAGGIGDYIKLAAEMCKTVVTSSGAVNVTEVQDQFAQKPTKQSGTSYPWVQKLNALVQNFSGQMDFSD